MPQPENFSDANRGDNDRIKFVDIDLSIARNNVEIELGGFSFLNVMSVAFDDATTISGTKTTGVAMARINDTLGTPILLNPGFEYRFSGATKLYVTNAAQANKMLRVYGSTGPNIKMNSQPTVTVSSLPSVSIVGTPTFELTKDYNAHKRGASVFAVNGVTTATVNTIISAAANTTGIVLRQIALWAHGGAHVTLYARTTAPAAGDVFDAGGGQLEWAYNGAPKISFPQMLIPAGVGLYVVGNAAPSGSAYVTYDVLP